MPPLPLSSTVVSGAVSGVLDGVVPTVVAVSSAPCDAWLSSMVFSVASTPWSSIELLVAESSDMSSDTPSGRRPPLSSTEVTVASTPLSSPASTEVPVASTPLSSPASIEVEVASMPLSSTELLVATSSETPSWRLPPLSSIELTGATDVSMPLLSTEVTVS